MQTCDKIWELRNNRITGDDISKQTNKERNVPYNVPILFDKTNETETQDKTEL